MCFRRVVFVRRRERASAVTSGAAGRRFISPAAGSRSLSPSSLDSSRETRSTLPHVLNTEDIQIMKELWSKQKRLKLTRICFYILDSSIKTLIVEELEIR